MQCRTRARVNDGNGDHPKRAPTIHQSCNAGNVRDFDMPFSSQMLCDCTQRTTLTGYSRRSALADRHAAATLHESLLVCQVLACQGSGLTSVYLDFCIGSVLVISTSGCRPAVLKSTCQDIVGVCELQIFLRK
jgi:hypothetical protein